jgi:teichuronic acid biosynthesis glycosyltransferase TuaH
VLWGTDDFAAAGELMGTSPRWLATRETKQLRNADVIIAVSDQLARKWQGMTKRPISVIPNGCDTRLYAEEGVARKPADLRLEAPIAIFVGHLSERIDISLLEGVADSGISLLLVGPRQETFSIERIAALLARPNVQWVGNKPFHELASYLAVSAVGLTPYTKSDFNRASFPLKTLEYLAAGLPVVSSDLPATRQLATDLVTIVSGREQFGRAAADLSRARPDMARRQRAKEFASLHDWDVRVADIAALLGLPVQWRSISERP